MHFGAPYELSLAHFEVNCSSCNPQWDNRYVKAHSNSHIWFLGTFKYDHTVTTTVSGGDDSEDEGSDDES